jgi:hypothetical protein
MATNLPCKFWSSRVVALTGLVIPQLVAWGSTVTPPRLDAWGQNLHENNPVDFLWLVCSKLSTSLACLITDSAQLNHLHMFFSWVPSLWYDELFEFKVT